MKSKGMTIIWIRVIMFILISLYSIVVFGQTPEPMPRKSEQVFKVYPTVSTFDHRLDLEAEEAQPVVVKWVDMIGRVMMTERFQLEKGSNSFSVRNQARLPKGSYILTVLVDGRRYSERLLIM